MFKYSLNILNYRMQYVIQILIASFGRFHNSQQDTAQIIAEFKFSSTSWFRFLFLILWSAEKVLSQQ